MKVAALYVEESGAYSWIPDVDAWCVSKDARSYNGPYPVVAHPPCNRYGPLGRVNFIRYGGEQNRMGNDKGCFAAALAAVNVWHGVLEHPANSLAWPMYNLKRPNRSGWRRSGIGWVCEVQQSVYGHKARKRTWLYYRGFEKPFELNWTKKEGTHRIGHDASARRTKPYLQKKAASETPPPFRDLLLALARHSRRTDEKELSDF